MSERGLTWADLRNAILFGALIYLILRFLGQIGDVLLLFSIIGLIVVSLDPVVSWMHRHKIPRPAATAILALLGFASGAILLYFLVPVAGQQLADLWREVPGSIDKLQRWHSSMSDHPILGPLADYKIDLASLQQYIKPLLGGVTKFTESALGLVAAVLLVFISTVYSLNNPTQLTQGFLTAVRPAYRARAEKAGKRLAAQVRAWSIGLVAAMFFIFLVTWIVLALMGFKQAFLFAVIAGLTEAIPIVGPILGGVLPTIVALGQSPTLALWVVVAFILIQQFENHILIPQVMSRSLSLHPVTVIFSVLVMGGLFGIIGVFLATPAAVAAGVLYDELYLCGFREGCKDEAETKQSPEPPVPDE